MQGTAVPQGLEIERTGSGDIAVRGSLGLAQADRLWKELAPLLGSASRVDLSGVQSMDGGTAALLLHLIGKQRAAGRTIELVGVPADVEAMLELGGAEARADEQAPPSTTSVFVHVGDAVVEILADIKSLFEFTGEFVVAFVAIFRAPRTIQWRDVGPLIERVGADGLPIVALISLLMGLIMGFQSALQLEKYGANIYVADLVGLSITRELGPLMTAIILAGRSGAGFAAEMGTMKVSEEIDALKTMGLDPYRHLVMPRTIALLVATPILTLISSLLGIFGGMIIGVGQLGLTPATYFARCQVALHLWDFGGGSIKAVAFALLIAFVCCERGLSTRGGAEGVGRSTTSTVVIILFMLVLLDLLFTILFTVWGV